LQVNNNERNLQIPVDDKANGFSVKVTWVASSTAAATPSHHHYESSSVPAPLGLQGEGAQLWAKRQPRGGSAALLINHSPKAMNYTLDFAKLNLTGSSYQVRDIWAAKDMGPSSKQLPIMVPAYDSAFFLLTPAGARRTD
jgi:hypothetical protein